ncbi:uncharacterized protein CMU_025770 [Cryptosporidium muris RN66]|uniref:Ribosomal RNA-processing protein 14/surfeit locus protein 6 C-terminal domain-containing protein n=1 Tax=Cryptosporidium muris (strain RN66) TaxID=441375 RepID=B6AB18_CRYMR|nr:uncharacterized protein CMU_025770 [Cryptosporidium muris RN66]EEA05570.1 hypothetical protein, conserved [Cryptosporidium muris RN66]|eukprot:XP_002139919.1 hypothetical protein [Cryptosporidium muris RN66]
MKGIWTELGCFSYSLNLLPSDILLHTEEEVSTRAYLAKSKMNTKKKSSALESKIQRYSPNTLLTSLEIIKRHFDANKEYKTVGEQRLSGDTILPVRSEEPITRNELKERLAKKIAELRQNKILRNKNRQDKREKKQKLIGIKQKEIDNQNSDIEDHQCFGNIITPSNTSDLQNKKLFDRYKGSKIKRIEESIKKIKEEEIWLDTLPDHIRNVEKTKIAMEKALQRANRVKVKDNLSKLMKSKKQILAKKEKSRKRWENIKKANEEKAKISQLKRQENINLYRKK